uniref:Glycosylphosphatidylinositol anchor attachment 1 n=1 Tax=Oncorhynchus tshawytscha TaxID=74940 RepID=A0A8C8JMG1_ONCTS
MGLLSDPNQRRALTDLLTCFNAFISSLSLTHPFLCLSASLGQMVHGTNIYGILRAPRAPHTDALVLGAPCGEGNNDNQAGPCQIHWAKDTFLMNEHDLIGMQACRRDTIMDSVCILNVSVPSTPNLGGSIQAALSMEQSSDIITSLHLVLEGLNGQLPNLDLLQRNDWDSTWGYIHAAQIMMVLKQASGRPWGNHGPFLRYHIETATVRGINTFRQYKTDTTTIGRSAPGGDIPEAEQPPGASAPVLLLMPSLSRFASSGYYMPAFGQLAVIMLLHYLFPKGDLDKRGGWLELAKRGGWVGILSPLSSSPGILSILTPVVISHMTGVALYTLPILSQQMAVQHFPVSETETVVLTAIYKQGFCLLSPSSQGQVTEQGWRMLKLVALLYLAVLLGCTALINFSLGFIVALSLGILDHALYDSLVYPLLALPIYPCWLLLWNILFWK